MRLLSDHRLARDPRTTCQWQAMIDNQERLKKQFSDAMFKLSLVGQKKSAMYDCSEVIPPARSEKVSVSYPPTLSRRDVEQVCLLLPYPKLATRPGPPLVVPPLSGHGEDEEEEGDGGEEVPEEEEEEGPEEEEEGPEEEEEGPEEEEEDPEEEGLASW